MEDIEKIWSNSKAKNVFLNNFSCMVLTFKLLMVTLLNENIYIIGQTCYYYRKSCGVCTNIIWHLWKFSHVKGGVYVYYYVILIS